MPDNIQTASSRLPLWAAWFVALVCVAILGHSIWHEWQSRAAVLLNADVKMANLAHSLTQHTEDTYDLADASIVGFVRLLESEGTSPQWLAKLQNGLAERKALLPRISNLFIYDENGHCLATSGVPGPDVSDREYFRHHKATPDRAAFFGKPVAQRPGTGPGWITTVSRRFNHADGSFGGVVLATVGTEYFAGFYKQFDIGQQGSIALLHTSGLLMARSPDNDVYVGRDLSNSRLFRERRPDAGVYAGTYDFTSPLDGLQRLSFYKWSNRYPIVMVATAGLDETLAPWRSGAFVRLSMVFALTSLIAGIGFFLVRQLVERQRLVSALAATEAGFRVLAEESSDLVTRVGTDGALQYVSPSSLSVLGWRPDQLIGVQALAGVRAEDLAPAQEVADRLFRGEIPDARISYRTRRKDGAEIWIESSVRATRHAETGLVDGVVSVSRDITAQKESEAKLAALAMLDSLTGLPNRRRFDERLAEEWARAGRDGSSLSLLLIDVDHFKKFNDQHGHQAGDLCLQKVAVALAGEAHRPADLAARYGGEEFVLLLPDTEAAGCKLVGERIQRELRKLGIDHAQNAPGLRVTVSLGGATFAPAFRVGSSISALIEAADQALYEAKRRGRDRIVMSPAGTGRKEVA